VVRPVSSATCPNAFVRWLRESRRVGCRPVGEYGSDSVLRRCVVGSVPACAARYNGVQWAPEDRSNRHTLYDCRGVDGRALRRRSRRSTTSPSSPTFCCSPAPSVPSGSSALPARSSCVLSCRVGVQPAIDIPRSNIASVELSHARISADKTTPEYVRLVTQPSVMIVLHEAQIVSVPFGATRSARRIAFAVDDVKKFTAHIND
jgi:hypothetical protein